MSPHQNTTAAPTIATMIKYTASSSPSSSSSALLPDEDGGTIVVLATSPPVGVGAVATTGLFVGTLLGLAVLTAVTTTAMELRADTVAALSTTAGVATPKVTACEARLVAKGDVVPLTVTAASYWDVSWSATADASVAPSASIVSVVSTTKAVARSPRRIRRDETKVTLLTTTLSTLLTSSKLAAKVVRNSSCWSASKALLEEYPSSVVAVLASSVKPTQRGVGKGVGLDDGAKLGLKVGLLEGKAVGVPLGRGDGGRVGAAVGLKEGREVGSIVPGVGARVKVGSVVGSGEGSTVTEGARVGVEEGPGVGGKVGAGVGSWEGELVGAKEGASDRHQPKVWFWWSVSRIESCAVARVSSICAPETEEATSTTTNFSYSDSACSQIPSTNKGTLTSFRTSKAANSTIPPVLLKSAALAQSSFTDCSLTAVDPATEYRTLTAVALLPMRSTTATPLVPSSNGPKLVCSKNKVGATGTSQVDSCPTASEHTNPASTVQLPEHPSLFANPPSSQASKVVRTPSPQTCVTASTVTGLASAAAAASAAAVAALASSCAA
mmetsp:Transcript_4931/g.8393  ORF Transcript_4931/g.8393 Transcript_4931/m.8393 type:complete len:553 (+) Transcript_4931:1205-2863(+)